MKIACIIFAAIIVAPLAVPAQTTSTPISGAFKIVPPEQRPKSVQIPYDRYLQLIQHRPKIAVYNLNLTVFLTKEGRAAELDIISHFAPRNVELQELKDDVDKAQKRLGEETQKPGADRIALINAVTEAETKANEFQTKLEADERDAAKAATQQIASRLVSIAQEYAAKQGYDLLIDLGGPSNPVSWVRDGDDIKFKVAAAYDAARAAETTTAKR